MKKSIVKYVLDADINFDDRNYVRWIYYNDIKTKYMITKDGDVISVRKSGRKYMKMQTDKDGYKCVNIRVNKKNRVSFKLTL